MHDGADIVLDIACRHLVPRILLEVALVAGQDVLEVNGDVVVSVRSGLLVVETDGVADLVSDDSQLREKLEKIGYWFTRIVSQFCHIGSKENCCQGKLKYTQWK